MEISFTELLLLALASFRLTRLIVFDKITAFIRRPFFDEVEEIDEDGQIDMYLVPKEGRIRGFFGELLGCYWCTGIWSSVFLCILYYLYPYIAVPLLIILSVAALAAMMESIIQKLLN